MNKELLAMVLPEPTEEEIRNLCREKRDELGFDIEKALFPVNPFEIEPSISVDDAVELLRQWDSVRGSVEVSVWASVWASVWDFVWRSVWVSVRDSVRGPDGDSVWAYISTIFYGIEEWEGIDHNKGENPFKPAADLWESGYIASYDGETWRLHTKNGIAWEGEA